MPICVAFSHSAYSEIALYYGWRICERFSPTCPFQFLFVALLTSSPVSPMESAFHAIGVAMVQMTALIIRMRKIAVSFVILASYIFSDR